MVVIDTRRRISRLKHSRIGAFEILIDFRFNLTESLVHAACVLKRTGETRCASANQIEQDENALQNDKRQNFITSWKFQLPSTSDPLTIR